jgi:hypothetical protein
MQTINLIPILGVYLVAMLELLIHVRLLFNELRTLIQVGLESSEA